MYTHILGIRLALDLQLSAAIYQMPPHLLGGVQGSATVFPPPPPPPPDAVAYSCPFFHTFSSTLMPS